MSKALLVLIGSGVGGLLRYGLSTAIYSWGGRGFPYGTLVVNVLGCFLIGLLFILLLERVADLADQLRALLLIGLLGGFTTFSSFTLETFNLFENGELAKTLINIGASVILCLAATWLGVVLGRQL